MNKSSHIGELRQRSVETFDYHVPTRLLGGPGSIAQLPAELSRYGIANPLIITDTGIRAAGVLDVVVHALEDEGRDIAVFDSIAPDPTTDSVDQAARVLREHKHDGVIALGGGSSLDAAKAAAVVATSEQPALELVGPDKIDVDPLPVIAVPTTAGTGSEVTRFCVLSEPGSHRKVSISSMRVLPVLAILDPELTTGLPEPLTAATGFDALAHAIESYGSVWNNPIAEGHARNAVGLIGQHLLQALKHPTDITARSGMLAASCIAELAANSTRLGLTHALAVPLGGAHGIPHGVAVALMLPQMCAYNEAVEPERYRELAQLLSPGAANLEQAVYGLREAAGLSSRLGDWNVAEEHFAPIVEIAVGSDNTHANPRAAGPNELTELLRGGL